MNVKAARLFSERHRWSTSIGPFSERLKRVWMRLLTVISRRCFANILTINLVSTKPLWRSRKKERGWGVEIYRKTTLLLCHSKCFDCFHCGQSISLHILRWRYNTTSCFAFYYKIGWMYSLRMNGVTAVGFYSTASGYSGTVFNFWVEFKLPGTSQYQGVIPSVSKFVAFERKEKKIVKQTKNIENSRGVFLAAL